MQCGKPYDCERFGEKFGIVQRRAASGADMEKRSFCSVNETTEIFN